jgi:hypothetical protein
MWIDATPSYGERDAAPGFAPVLGADFFVRGTGNDPGWKPGRLSPELPGILSNLTQLSVIAIYKYIP